MEIELAQGLPEAVNQKNIAVASTFLGGPIWGDLGAVKDFIAQTLKPVDGSFFNMAFGEFGVHATTSTAFSASRRWISPDMSFGRRRSRV